MVTLRILYARPDAGLMAGVGIGTGMRSDRNKIGVNVLTRMDPAEAEVYETSVISTTAITNGHDAGTGGTSTGIGFDGYVIRFIALYARTATTTYIWIWGNGNVIGTNGHDAGTGTTCTRMRNDGNVIRFRH